MTRQLFRDLLDEEWVEDADEVDGRVKDVAKPTIIAEKGQKRHDLSNSPLCTVRDGGTGVIEPIGLGWEADRSTDLISLSLECTEEHGGEVYMNGYRAGPDGDEANDLDPYEAEAYGGLTGEVKRILDTYRKGVAEYQLVEGYEVDDASGEMGYGRWRVDVEVRLTSHVSDIEL